MLCRGDEENERCLHQRDEIHAGSETLCGERFASILSSTLTQVTGTDALQEALRHSAGVQHQRPRGGVVQLEQVQHAMHHLGSQTLEGARVEQVVEHHANQLQQREGDAEGAAADHQTRARRNHIYTSQCVGVLT